MKYQLIFFLLLLNLAYCYAQSNLFFPLIKKIDWSKIDKQDDKLKEVFIKSNHSFFENSITGGDVSYAKNHLHLIDLNDDKLLDIIFQGNRGADTDEISIYINLGTSFQKVFTAISSVVKMEFEDNKLNKIHIINGGCCGEYLTNNLLYQVTYKNNIPQFTLLLNSAYLEDTELPKFYFEKPIHFKTLNDTYNMRLQPVVDDISEKYSYDREDIKGNIIGKLQKNTIGFALSEYKDNTGRVWWFAAFSPEIKIKDTFFHQHDKNEIWKLGWISSRFVEIVKE